MKEPPRLASLLLKHFGPKDDSLIGDLREAYSGGKSRWWYWRQVLAAIATTNDRLTIARGVLVGWATLWSFRFLTSGLNRAFAQSSLDWLIINLGSHPFVMLWAVVFSGRPFQIAAYLFSGWVVARLHRRCSSIAVFAFMVTVLIRSAWDAANWFKTQVRVYDEVAFPIWMAAFAALPVIILVGGWFANRLSARTVKLA